MNNYKYKAQAYVIARDNGDTVVTIDIYLEKWDVNEIIEKAKKEFEEYKSVAYQYGGFILSLRGKNGKKIQIAECS